MRSPFIFADPVKCTGCGVCQLICALSRDNIFDPKYSRIRILQLHRIMNVAVTCRFCEDAPCVAACPRDALKQSKETGVIEVIEDKCDGCRWCIEACEHGAITMKPNGEAVMICDLCGEDEPQCLEWCPEGAISLVTDKEANEKIRFFTAKNLIPKI